MNIKKAAIFTAYTGIAFEGDKVINAFHKYVEEKFERPVFLHEMAKKEFWIELRKLSEEDFRELCEEVEND